MIKLTKKNIYQNEIKNFIKVYLYINKNTIYIQNL